MEQYFKYVEKLKGLGFTSNESKVYLNLVKLGSAKAGTIAKDAELDRSSTYNALKNLLKKGLASYVTIGKIKWFQSSSSNSIVAYLSDQLESAKEVLPDLERLRKENKLNENVTLFKGHKGIKTVFEDILEHGTENLIFGSEGQLSRNMSLFAKQFIRQFERKGIKMKSIVRTNREDTRNKRNYRSIPSATESPVVTNIYGDKIAVIIWSEIPEAILIENKKAADAYRDYFNFMWRYAKR